VEEGHQTGGRLNQTPVAAQKSGDHIRAGTTRDCRAPSNLTTRGKELSHLRTDRGRKTGARDPRGEDNPPGGSPLLEQGREGKRISPQSAAGSNAKAAAKESRNNAEDKRGKRGRKGAGTKQTGGITAFFLPLSPEAHLRTEM